jgi:FixJ family two-component response regulator
MRERGLTPPVILTSGYPAEEVTFDDGIAGFVEKPFRRETLLRAIETALEHKGRGGRVDG